MSPMKSRYSVILEYLKKSMLVDNITGAKIYERGKS